MGKTRVVLVEPQQPANVGAAARAMKNMGLDDLLIVNPPCFDPERARWMAPGCEDLIASMRIVGTLDEALAGAHRVVGTTARHRRHRQRVIEPMQLANEINNDSEERVTAVLFGREDFGLSAEMILRCEALVRIPTPEHASLNLAQAVLLVSHAVFEEARLRGLADAPGRTVGGSRGTVQTQTLQQAERAADLIEIEGAVTAIVGLLDGIGYTRSVGSPKVAMTCRGALQRASLTHRELNALRGMVDRIEKSLERNTVPEPTSSSP